MSDTSELLTPVRASTRRSRRIPVIWAIPLLAIAIGGWLAWDTLSKRGPDDHDFLRQRRRAAGRPIAAQVQGHRAWHRAKPDPGAGSHPRAGQGRNDQTGRAAAHRADHVLGRQAEAVRGQCIGPRYAALGLLYRHAAGRKPTGQRQREFTGREDPPLLEANVPGTHLPAEGEPDRLDLPRLAGVLPRSQRWRGARLGHRRHGRERDDPRLRAGAVRQICAGSSRVSGTPRVFR